MLVQLRIQGLAIIDSLVIDFQPTFNVITGETGAGKSILIKALGLLFGAKASTEMIRSSAEVAEISGTFHVPTNHPVIASLDRLGIVYEIDNDVCEVIVRRQISRKSKSHSWVNDTPITTNSIKELGYTLIDIFGQFDNQKLLNPAEHLYFLDAFLPNQTVKERYQECFRQIETMYHEIAEKVEQFSSKLRDQDYYKFRLDEIEQFDPSLDDYARVENVAQRAKFALVRQDKMRRLQDLLDHEDSSPFKALATIVVLCADLQKYDNRFVDITAQAKDVAAQSNELSFTLGRVLSDEDFDQEDFEQAEERLARYQQFFRKFGVKDIAGLLAEQNILSENMHFLDGFAQEVKKTLKQLTELVQKALKIADELAQQRRTAAAAVGKKILRELTDLNIAGAQFQVDFGPVTQSWPSLDLVILGDDLQHMGQNLLQQLHKISADGGEKIQFLFSANPGEPPRPMHKIASGGEVSRIMLALKKALAAGAETCVLVFDEIDSGISGRAADVVGKKMKELAEDFQIICISHLAQVAAYASAHFLVEKVVQKNRTESRIVPLSVDDSVAELARLLSGTEVTEQSLKNARSMRRAAQQSASTH